MDSKVNFPTMYRFMIENKLKKQDSYYLNGETRTAEHQNEDLGKTQESNKECKFITKPSYGYYVLKRKNVYYLPQRALFNNPSAIEMVNIYANLRKNKIEKVSSLSIDCDSKTVTASDLNEEFSHKEAKFIDCKKNNLYTLPYSDGFSTIYSNVSEKGDVINEECLENSHMPKASFINRLLSVLHQYYILPFIISEDFSCTSEKFPTEIVKEYDSKSTNFDAKIPEVTTTDNHERYYINKMDDETYEFMSILEGDCEDFREQPRDALLKGTLQEEFEFQSEADNSEEKSLESPFLRRFSTCSPYSSKFDFRPESDRSVEDDVFIVDPIFRDAHFDRQKVISGDEKKGFGIVAYFKAMMRKDICKYIKS